MNNKSLLRVMIGGILALLIIIALVIAVVFHELKQNHDSVQCIHSCAFVQDVRHSGKYADKTDTEIAVYGQQLCETMRSGETRIVYALEKKEIVDSAIINLCPEVAE